MENYALVIDGEVKQVIGIDERQHTLEQMFSRELLDKFIPLAGNAVFTVKPGWLYDGAGFSLRPTPPAPAVTRYVSVPTIRERLEAKDKWADLIAILSQDMAKLTKVLTLRDGIDVEDAEARGLIEAIGCDPDEILAP